ncbi:MAG: hypothetical protein HY775_02945, partial [Acidobacteria bacterium]|nr:hypothetical protein [Acidobacteriota bacterium]
MNRRARAVMLTLAVLLAVLLPVPSRPAAASGPSVLVQHFELLSETQDALAQETSLVIRRGVLPGGTQAFNPAPTASFEVSGSVQGAQAGSFWTLQLLGSVPGEFARLSFLPDDTAPTLKLAPFSWPGSDEEIIRILATPQGSFPGTLSIRKAYIAIRQEGTILATAARIPMATRQLAITAQSLSDLADPLYYSHAGKDFHLVPGTSLQARLRVTARLTSGASFEASLVDSSGVVAGPPVVFQQISTAAGPTSAPPPRPVDPPEYRSIESGPFALADAALYRLKVKVSGTGASADLLSADLELFHATTDPKGLAETVAVYPGVSAPQDMAVSGSDLGFLFRSPERSAREETLTWTRTVKAPVGTGAADVLLRDRTAGADRSEASSPPGAVFQYRESQGAASSAGNILDSRSALGTMTTGRVAGSALRLDLVLGDIWAPVISGLAAVPTA